jgi:DNA topoisomerase VI subunit B
MMAATATLERTTFRTSRLLEFCSQKELVAQTGHEPDDWPLVILKELVDNALDACEEAGITPAIRVMVARGKIRVRDNGPGIPPATVTDILDFSSRVSSREAYVAPDRGAQGNALKTILAMPFALNGEEGRVAIVAWRAACDHLPRRSDQAGAGDRPPGRARSCKIRDLGDRPLAGVI